MYHVETSCKTTLLTYMFGLLNQEIHLISKVIPVVFLLPLLIRFTLDEVLVVKLMVDAGSLPHTDEFRNKSSLRYKQIASLAEREVGTSLIDIN